MFFKLAWRSLKRNPSRTWFTGSMIALGTSLLIIGISWIFGVQSSVINTMIEANGKVRITTADFEQKEQQFPISDNIVNTEIITETLRKEPAIQFVYTRLGQAVLWTKDGEELDENISIVVGISPQYYQEQLQIDEKIISGTMFKQKNELLIGTTLASEYSLQLQETLILFGQTQDGSPSPMKMTIVGICDFGNPIQNNTLFTSLSNAQWMADIPNGGTELLIYSEQSGQSIAALIKKKYPSLSEQSQTLDRHGNSIPFSVLSWDQREPFRSVLPILFFFDIFLISSIILVTALGILNTMIMSILEREKELGVLRAIGTSKKQLSKIILSETLLLTGVGGFIGCFLGSFIALGMESTGIPLGEALKNSGNIIANNTVYPDWRIEISILGFFLSLVMGILGTIFPLIHLFRTSIVDSLGKN